MQISLIRLESLTGVLKAYSVVWSATSDYADTQTLKWNSFVSLSASLMSTSLHLK